ncbi:MAG: hypothetical protein AB1489_18665 [Acidobacteriota bacterium]
MSTAKEIWQVAINNQVFQTDDFEMLKQWIAEGRIQPLDKVRKGSLEWREAARVPTLRNLFPNYPVATATNGPVCYFHPLLAPDYICRACGTSFCHSCTRFVGTSTLGICQLCGEPCDTYTQVQQRAERSADQQSGFGLSEFGLAISYPLKNMIALLVAASFYALLSAVGRVGSLIAYTLLFGSTSLVINQVAVGKMTGELIPDLSDIRESSVNAVRLGLGVASITLGPYLIVYFFLIEKLLGNSSLGMLVAETLLGMLPTDMPIGVQFFSEGGSLYTVLALLTGAWLFLYAPMALLVAGYTQDLRAIINPLVGLDTMRRMGPVYLKVFLMCLSLLAIYSILSMVIERAAFLSGLSFFPIFGGIIVSTFHGMVIFYLSLVCACLLGRALFKCAHRLNIEID